MNVNRLRSAILIATLALLPAGLSAQNAGTAPSHGAGQAGASASSILRITAPRNGERLRQNFINVQFELTNEGASASGKPNFQLKLDSQDPVTTSSTNYTFTGLTPGPHTVTVQLVDANGTPIAGARSEVPFVVLQPAPAPTPSAAISLRNRRPKMVQAALRVEQPRQESPENDDALPSAAGALPLLSVIGFGVLLGGIASAMKTRPK